MHGAARDAGGLGRARRAPIPVVCGDGTIGGTEECDDHNAAAGDGCDATCGGCVDPATLASTWAAVQANVFDRACTACHGEQATAGLDLRAPGAYAAIVDVAAASGLSQVKRGDHSQSLIWLKMAKSAIGGLDDLPGGGMPFGFPLPRPIVEAFGAWIDAGAPPDGYVAGGGAARALRRREERRQHRARDARELERAVGHRDRHFDAQPVVRQSTTSVARRTAGSSSIATSPVTNGTSEASCGMNARWTIDHENKRPRPDTGVHSRSAPPHRRHAPSGYQTKRAHDVQRGSTSSRRAAPSQNGRSGSHATSGSGKAARNFTAAP
jgi:cysteine-rich repeat protein